MDLKINIYSSIDDFLWHFKKIITGESMKLHKLSNYNYINGEYILDCILNKNSLKAKKKNMCVYGHPTHPNFQPPTLTFFIGNYSTIIFASDTINFYTEFG